MAFEGYHEAIWESLPEGLDPPYAGLRGSFLLERMRALARESGRPPRVLDVGCGEGHFTAQLARAGAAPVGADVSREALRRALARHPGLDLQVIPLQGQWPMADASFDAVWAGETIEHVADTAAWLSEVRRVLRPGGSLLLSTPAHGRVQMIALALSPRGIDRHFDPRSDHLRFYSARTLRRLLEDFGFEHIDVRGAAGVPGARRLLLACARRGRF
jgi:2-polyprenyl-3-methyl-5-hydroxy-6-metoxy-1,4-benzoquinol methylase